MQVDGILKIDDAAIVRIGDGHGEIDLAGEAFVGSRVAKGAAVGDRLSGRDFDAHHARLQPGYGGEKKEQGEADAAEELHRGRIAPPEEEQA